jgi:hypothetical protein
VKKYCKNISNHRTIQSLIRGPIASSIYYDVGNTELVTIAAREIKKSLTFAFKELIA